MLGELTKIIATIGPSSFDEKIMADFVKEGVDIMRLNTAHGTLDEHKELIKRIRKVSHNLDKEIGVFLDLPGPKARLGELSKPLTLTKSHKICLRWNKEVKAPYKTVDLEIPKVVSKVLEKKSVVAIDDGKILLRIDGLKKHYASASVIAGGEVSSHKGISVLGKDLPVPPLTKKDEKALSLAKMADFLAVSFVKNIDDIKLIKKKIGKGFIRKKNKPFIIAKIETREAVKNIDDIINAVDGILIARGDLALAIDTARLGVVQKEIAIKTRQAGKPVIVATQMLDSMTLKPVPTRAEILDVTNAVADHVDAVMLSSESASGKFPQESVKLMAQISKATEESPFNDLPLEPTQSNISPHHLFSHYLADFVKQHRIKIVLNENADKELLKLISTHRIEASQVVPVKDFRQARRLNILWGAVPVVTRSKKSLLKTLKQKNILQKGNVVLSVGWHKKSGRNVGYARLEKVG